jgi:hypothetical protein
MSLCRAVLTAVVLLAVHTAAASGQATYAGVRVGVTSARQADEGEDFRGTRADASGGAFVTLAVSDLVAMQLELLASQKGWDHSPDVYLHLTYIEFPLLFTVRASSSPLRPFIAGGVSPAVEVSCSYAFPPPPAPASQPALADCAQRRTGKFDVGMALGGGVEWDSRSVRLALEARYVHGVVDLARDIEYRVAKNRAGYLLASVAVRL